MKYSLLIGGYIMFVLIRSLFSESQRKESIKNRILEVILFSLSVIIIGELTKWVMA